MANCIGLITLNLPLPRLVAKVINRVRNHIHINIYNNDIVLLFTVANVVTLDVARLSKKPGYSLGLERTTPSGDEHSRTRHDVLLYLSGKPTIVDAPKPSRGKVRDLLFNYELSTSLSLTEFVITENQQVPEMRILGLYLPGLLGNGN